MFKAPVHCYFRRKKQALWDKAVKFLSTNESRVRVEMITIEGEEFAVWRWLPSCPNGSKVWQGQGKGNLQSFFFGYFVVIMTV